MSLPHRIEEQRDEVGQFIGVVDSLRQRTGMIWLVKSLLEIKYGFSVTLLIPCNNQWNGDTSSVKVKAKVFKAQGNGNCALGPVRFFGCRLYATRKNDQIGNNILPIIFSGIVLF